jgi:hypothetical protein
MRKVEMKAPTVIVLFIFASLLVPLSNSPKGYARGIGLPLQAIGAGPSDDQEIFFDDDGLIIHREGGLPNGKQDGGDTAQREGWYWLGVWIRQNTSGLPKWPHERLLNFDQVLALLEPQRDGVFYRHPKMTPFNNPHDKKFGTSRDQLVPLIAAMGVWGKKAHLRRLWDAMPEDMLGKHAFNGNWRNFLGQDGANCSDIKKRGCDATADCSLKTDNRVCSLKSDDRDCSLKEDQRDCSVGHDTRNCSVSTPLGSFNDPVCEAAKAAQNAAYAAQKASCEAAKAGQNLAYKAEKDACEAAKATQNAAYKAEKDGCEAGKASQNALYAKEKAACEAAKTSSKLGCEADKAAAQLVCLASNVHSGDLIGPATVNLFRRAMGENPAQPTSTLMLPPVNIGGAAAGEAELAVNVGLRNGLASKDRDDTGDDLNLVVALLMAKMRFATPISNEATRQYSDRPPSFGSFLRKYRELHGYSTTDQTMRIADGIRSGWQPEMSGPAGAVRWYHRPESGANPRLATLYEPIIAHFIR